MRRLVPLLALTGACHAPVVQAWLEPADASSGASSDAQREAATDAAPETLRTFRDGAACTGHDEDGDGFPDACDTCPTLPNPEQEFELQTKYYSVGRACAALSPYQAATKRAFFDPFTELSPRWTYNGPSVGAYDVFPADKPEFLSTNDFDQSTRILSATSGIEPRSAVVATSIWATGKSVSEGAVFGVFARAGGAPLRFLTCFLQPGSEFGPPIFGLGYVGAGGCTPAACPIVTVGTKPVPSTLFHPGWAIGLRISVARGDMTGAVECRIFDAKIPGAVATNVEDHAITATLSGEQYLPEGGVGYFIRAAIQWWSSLDVLVEP